MLGPENQEADSEVLGRVSNAFLRIGGRGSHMIWKHKRETGGGAINEMLVHMLDLSHWFFGPIAKIEDLVTTTKWASREIEGQTVDVDTEDYVLLRATTKSGVEVLVQADMITPAFTQYAEIQGENGSFFGSIQGDMPDFVFCTKPAGAYLGGKNALQPGNSNLFQGQMTNFLDAIEGKAAPRCSVQDALKTMELTAEIRQRAGL
jgi:predicted dehydrogenase